MPSPTTLNKVRNSERLSDCQEAQIVNVTLVPDCNSPQRMSPNQHQPAEDRGIVNYSLQPGEGGVANYLSVEPFRQSSHYIRTSGGGIGSLNQTSSLQEL